MAKKRLKSQPVALPENLVFFPGVKKVSYGANKEEPKQGDCTILLELGRLIEQIEDSQIRRVMRAAWKKAGVISFAEGSGLVIRDPESEN